MEHACHSCSSKLCSRDSCLALLLLTYEHERPHSQCARISTFPCSSRVCASSTPSERDSPPPPQKRVRASKDAHISLEASTKASRALTKPRGGPRGSHVARRMLNHLAPRLETRWTLKSDHPPHLCSLSSFASLASKRTCLTPPHNRGAPAET